MILCRQFICAVIFCCFTLSCNTNTNKLPLSNSPRYDLLNPVIIKLPDALAEISGIVYYPKDTAVFAIEDEDGIFYKISLNRKDEIKKWRFDKKHDFEDIVLLDSVFYILISNGNIETLQFDAGDSIVTTKAQFPEGSKKVNEFESLYYDDSLRQLVLLCKNCDGEVKNQTTAWGYSIAEKIYTPGVLTINLESSLQKLGLEKIKLRPSATALNPVTNEIYILASINNLLIVTDRQGNVKEHYALDPAIYKQPEGIAFTPAGDMLISNEWHETGLATILVIKNKMKGL
ncbi:hypothetical protein [Ferruginibacter sp.]